MLAWVVLMIYDALKIENHCKSVSSLHLFLFPNSWSYFKMHDICFTLNGITMTRSILDLTEDYSNIIYIVHDTNSNWFTLMIYSTFEYYSLTWQNISRLWRAHVFFWITWVVCPTCIASEVTVGKAIEFQCPVIHSASRSYPHYRTRTTAVCCAIYWSIGITYTMIPCMLIVHVWDSDDAIPGI